MSYTGWLTPTADLIKCDGHAHVVMAMELVKRFYDINENVRADEILLKHGWVRISKMTYNDEGLMFFLPPKFVISELQYSFLEHIYNDDPTQISQKGMAVLRELKIAE